jgi:anionic cell wall polymer biosynthesis LytR-Cps2A-Psr (LCP) family protein
MNSDSLSNLPIVLLLNTIRLYPVMATSNSITQEPEKKTSEDNSPVIKDKKATRRKIAFSRFKRKALQHIMLIRLGIVASMLIVLFVIGYAVFSVFRDSTVGKYATLASDFVFTPMEKVKSTNNMTNILILGKGGGEHDAPDLTDSIIFLSINHEQMSLSAISLPRDIWVAPLRAKLNSMYYWGNQKEPPVEVEFGQPTGGGLKLAKAEAEAVIGEPVHYGVVIDFNNFKELIDIVGGVEVEVQNSFVDEKYPIEGKENDDCDGDPEYKCRYETVSFESGVQLMDGETALKYSRSRNSEGDEGTDIAREARQQSVFISLKNKLSTKLILTSPSTLIQIKDVVLQNLETDLDPSAAAILARKAIESRDTLSTHVLPDKFLVNPDRLPKYDNLYVFIPSAGDWGEVHAWVNCILDDGDCD